MNFPDFGSAISDTDNLTCVMSTASSSGSGNGGSNNDPNHNIYSKNGSIQDPFSFLEDDEDEVDISMGLLVKPLRDPLISLDDLDDFINNVEISDAIVPSSALVTPVTGGVSHGQTMLSTGSIFSQAPTQQLSQQLQVQIQQDVSSMDDHDRRTNAASAAATSALLKSWMVPQELIMESANGFAMVLDPRGTIEYVSDTVRCHVGHPGQLMRGQSIYTYVAQADHEKIAMALHPHNLVSPENGSGITANADLNYRRTFAVRFLVGAHSKGVTSGFESLLISSVPLHRVSKTTPSLLCVARKIVSTPANPQQYQQGRQMASMHQQPQPLAQGSSNQSDLFSTRLEPTSFRITHSETDKVSLSLRVTGMIGKSFLEFCPQEDQEIIRAHFLETLQSTNEVSPTLSKPYRITGLFGSTSDPQQQRSIRVMTRSKYIKPNNHLEKGYITSTHFVFRGIQANSTPQQTYPSTTTSLTNILGSNNKPQTLSNDPGFGQMRTPRRARSPPLSPPSESQQKNLLLKQLLNTTYSCADEDPSREQSPPFPNTRILKLLNQTENVPRFKRGEDGSKSVSPQPATVLNSSNLSSTSRQRLKRSASGSALDDEPFPKTSASSLDSPVCRENPSLVNLLVKPLPIAVPPPVPTKWHQEPKEKLPKDTMRKYLPPHPADRASISSASGPSGNSTLSASVTKTFDTIIKSEPSESLNIQTSETHGLLLQTVQTVNSSSFLQPQVFSNFPQPSSPLLDISLNDNDLLSEILDGLIDFQEKSPVGRAMDSMTSPAVAQMPSQPESHISTIEKYLASTEKTVLVHPQPTDQPTFQPKASSSSSNSTLSSLLSSPPMVPSPMRHLSGNSTFMNPVQQQQGPGVSRQSAASMVHRMSELLQVVPPNVSVTDAPQDSMESIMMQERRRRMSSGGGGVISFTQQPQLQRPLQQQRATYTEVVDPREVIPSAAFPARPPIRPMRHQQFTSVKSPASLPSPQPSYSAVSSSFQTFSGGSVIVNQQPISQIQANDPNFIRRGNFSGSMQGQQPQMLNHGMQQNNIVTGHSTVLSGALQSPHQRSSGNNLLVQDNRIMAPDDKRSLLQQLLSE